MAGTDAAGASGMRVKQYKINHTSTVCNGPGKTEFISRSNTVPHNLQKLNHQTTQFVSVQTIKKNYRSQNTTKQTVEVQTTQNQLQKSEHHKKIIESRTTKIYFKNPEHVRPGRTISEKNYIS